MTDEQKDLIINFTKDYYRLSLRKDDEFCIERYVDYRDEFPQSTIKEILSSDNPTECFDENVLDWDINCDDWYYQDDFFSKLEEYVATINVDIDEARDIVYDNFCWTYPDDFLNPTFKAVIEIDTGDGNYDFVLHNLCNWYSENGYGGEFDKKAGLYWLAKTQRRLGLLKKAIKESDHYSNGDCSKSKFVGSCITDLVNLPTHMGALTFLVEMSLSTALRILSTIKQHADNKDFDIYNPQNTKGFPFGYIVLDKNTETGIFDRWNGSGSPFEIELERDVKIPLHYINSISTDDLIQDVYGMCGSCWRDTIKEIA